jgi:YD repeat-containing protein
MAVNSWTAVLTALPVLAALLAPHVSPQAANGSVAYTYDALGRLLTASYDTGVCIAYAYDANGNRKSEKILVVAPSSTGVWGCFNWNGAKWGP